MPVRPIDNSKPQREMTVVLGNLPYQFEKKAATFDEGPPDPALQDACHLPGYALQPLFHATHPGLQPALLKPVVPLGFRRASGAGGDVWKRALAQ